MLVLVVSDFHLGKGQYFKNGQINLLEHFNEDERFVEFLEHYSSGEYLEREVHLVLNGDILNLIQVDIDGVFPNIVDASITQKILQLIFAGHKDFFDALRKFYKCPGKKITYIIGNHDAGMAFEEAQQSFKNFIGENIQFAFNVEIGNIYIEHGHRFEIINTAPVGKYFLEGPNGRKILNLPWGTLFCINLLPVLMKDRPNLDKIRPMSRYFKWSLIHDTSFFFKMAHLILKYLFETSFKTHTNLDGSFATTIKLLKQITIYPRFDTQAKSIFKKNSHLQTIVMGHSHVSEWRQFSDKKFYFNTGTWNPIPSIDAAMVEDFTNLTYVALEVNPQTNKIIRAASSVWKGTWRPYREESVVTGFDF